MLSPRSSTDPLSGARLPRQLPPRVKDRGTDRCSSTDCSPKARHDHRRFPTYRGGEGPARCGPRQKRSLRTPSPAWKLELNAKKRRPGQTSRSSANNLPTQMRSTEPPTSLSSISLPNPVSVTNRRSHCCIRMINRGLGIKPLWSPAPEKVAPIEGTA